MFLNYLLLWLTVYTDQQFSITGKNLRQT